MSRSIQLGDDEEVSLRQSLMAMEKYELVELVEEAMAKEIAAVRMSSRLMQRVALAEGVAKQRDAEWKDWLDQHEADIWDQALGGATTSVELLCGFLNAAVSGLLALTGGKRTVVARIYVDALCQPLAALPGDPWGVQRGGVEDTIAEHFFTLCQLANFEPTGKPVLWWNLGRTVYGKKSGTGLDMAGI